jgi:hypothetical protein
VLCCTLIVIILGQFVVERLSSVSSAEADVWRTRFQDGREVGTVVTQWLETGRGLLLTGNRGISQSHDGVRTLFVGELRGKMLGWHYNNMCIVKVEREEASSSVLEPATLARNCQHKI